MSELWKRSAVDVVDLLRSGEISPVEAVQAAIERIEAVDIKTNALPKRQLDACNDDQPTCHQIQTE